LKEECESEMIHMLGVWKWWSHCWQVGCCLCWSLWLWVIISIELHRPTEKDWNLRPTIKPKTWLRIIKSFIESLLVTAVMRNHDNSTSERGS